jgi:K+-sensing histidine kinase KdpD
VAVLFRYFFQGSLGLKVPYLQFYPPIVVAAWYGGLGPGLLTTALSTVAAMYYLLPPFGINVSDSADQLSLGVFVATGVVISWLNHRVRMTQEAQHSASAAATARAERLDSILNMTVDGIIVIDASGRIEASTAALKICLDIPRRKCLGAT